MTGTRPTGGTACAWIVARSSLAVALRDGTVLWLVGLFLAMVLVSAYLGWSATQTIDEIYVRAAADLAAAGRSVPPNPVGDMPPLAALRNMTTYVTLLGALAAIVTGVELVAEDRRSGIVPLIATRAVPRAGYALGKLSALVLIIVGLLAVAALANVGSLLILSGKALSASDWADIARFYGSSALFLTAFGALGLASAARTRSEAMGLLIPVSIWLTLTFVLPQIAADVNPMAALNPVKAMVAPPAGPFFEWAGLILAPVSLTSAYRDLAASILGFAPAASMSLGAAADLVVLAAGSALACIVATISIAGLDPAGSDLDE